jgi:cytoskeletal protein CcmA (bactofilin family)
MSLFGRDRRGRKPSVDPWEATRAPAVEAVGPREKEADMFERDKLQSDEGAEANTYLGKGSKVTGTLTFEGTVRVEGQVEGEISAQDTLIIGDTAVVNAQMTANSVIIKGKVTGDITARKRVEIRAPGKLFGNITTPSLVIHEGVVFEGHCSMGGAEAQKVDKRVALFPKEDRGQDGGVLKVHSEAATK